MERFIEIPISYDIIIRMDRQFENLITVISKDYDDLVVLEGIEALKLAELIKDIVNDDGQIDFDRVKKQG